MFSGAEVVDWSRVNLCTCGSVRETNCEVVPMVGLILKIGSICPHGKRKESAKS